MIDQLIDTLAREAALFESFLGQLEEQRQALLNNDVDRLNEVTAAMREKYVESQTIVRQREELVEQIKRANNLDGDVNVTRLVELVDEQQAGRLSHMRDLICGLDEKIVQVRNQNAMLLNRSREFIVKSMQMLSQVGRPEGGYSPQGSPAGEGSRVMVDRRA